MPDRPTLIFTCVFCPYRVQYTDDTREAVAAFILARLIAHCRDRHCLTELRAALVHVNTAEAPLWRDILTAAGPCTHDRPCEGEARPS
jgi:hypothetical protein